MMTETEIAQSTFTLDEIDRLDELFNDVRAVADLMTLAGESRQMMDSTQVMARCRLIRCAADLAC